MASYFVFFLGDFSYKAESISIVLFLWQCELFILQVKLTQPENCEKKSLA